MSRAATDPETQPPSVHESPLVKAIRDGSAPPQVKLAAARGALPVDRQALLGLLVLLRSDDDGEVKAAAEASLTGWSDDDLQAIAEATESAPEALAYILTARSDSSERSPP